MPPITLMSSIKYETFSAVYYVTNHFEINICRYPDERAKLKLHKPLHLARDAALHGSPTGVMNEAMEKGMFTQFGK